jgi:hypothetical protein
MYLARFSYDISPVDRQQAIDLIRREVKAACDRGLHARLLVPLTREHGGPALQFEIQVTDSNGTTELESTNGYLQDEVGLFPG